MNAPSPLDTEALIRREVDRAVAPYARVAPPVVLRKMRQLSERYWRENPVAIQAIRMMRQQQQIISGPEPIDGASTPDAAATGTDKE